ncbi:serine hydrolase domain-containing protein [Sphingomicrobium arenosum]|uniref:serine hydrolase domain-containing protein n=1 Tax=Sphingomicrobium arenosum TaxID=2233861 RepID=UPI00223F9263|nr:serine hydrolase domain-containing protein [Sphingomicrobium arenosum]
MFLTFAAALLAAPAPEAPSAAPAAHPKLAIVDEMAPRLLAQYDVPSVGIAYIEDGEIQFVTHHGEQEWGVDAHEETLYNVASLSKPVTAETVLRLATRGEVDLSMTLADHILEDDIKDDPRAQLITPRLVMRHRTGFPNWRFETDGVLKFIRDPDTDIGYSGEGYEWMYKAVEQATGRDFERTAKRLVFAENDMPLTSFTKTRDFRGRLAVPYKKGMSVRNAVHEDEMVASDDMRSTPREYARFMIDAMEGDDVSPELREEQRTIQHDFRAKSACKGEDRADFCAPASGWGLGWFIFDYGDRKIMEHTGGDFGEAALAYYDLVNRNGVVILTNGADGWEVIRRLAVALDDDKRWQEYLMEDWG